MSNKKSHHLWSAEKDESGKVMVRRNKKEVDNLEDMEREAFNLVEASAWGMYGAFLEDSFSYEMPKSIVDRFSLVAKSLQATNEEVPELYSWEKLTAAVGAESIENIKKSVDCGRKARRISKELDIPFIIAFDLLEDYDILGKRAMKEIIDGVKAGEAINLINEYGKPAIKVASLYGEAISTGNYKISVDESTENYWISYYGDFGKQLVEEIKKRVKAEVAKEWLIKNGVDEAAADYWKNYYGEVGDYGKELTEKVKKNKNKKDKEDKKDNKKD